MANKIQTLMVLVGLCLTCAGLAAQEPIPGSDDPPPQLTLPGISEGSGTRSYGSDDLPAPNQGSFDGSELEPIAEQINQGSQHDAEGLVAGSDDLYLFDCEPALMESTGTWLRRGFWFAELDVVVADRIWSRDPVVLAGQNVSTFGDINSLRIDGGQNGAEAAPRLKIGRFLFRDYENRDHTAEFVIYGGGQWSQGGRLDANPNNSSSPFPDSPNLQTNPLVSRGNKDFSGANTSQYTYDARMNSFEVNYQVASRMKRDRMELEPSGHWVRRAQPTLSRSLIAGIRFIDLTEDLFWEAFDIQDPSDGVTDANGLYDVRTDNHLIGTQLGATMTHERARWSFGLRLKGGMFLNHSDVDSRFIVSSSPESGNNTTFTEGDNFIEDDNISFLIEGAVLGKWHLRPNLSIRAGLEITYLSALALAPDQLNFVPVSTTERTVRNDVSFMGGTIGLEGYW